MLFFGNGRCWKVFGSSDVPASFRYYAIMRTLLLLAGRSERFWPLNEKALWPFCGKSLLQHQVDRLREGGFTEITFVGGHHNLEDVHQQFPGIPAIEQEDLSLGMRGALLSALPHVKEDAVCIVSSNDVIEPSGYATLLRASNKEGVEGALLAQKVSCYFPGGYLVTSPDDGGTEFPRVAGVMEKPGEGKEPSDLVNIVAHVHNNPAKLLDVLEDVSCDRDDAYEVALAKLCKETNYVAVPYEERWNAVKYPWHVLDVTERFLGGVGKWEGGRGGEVHPSAVVEGNVILKEGVRVLPHATVQGPCYIGAGTIIGNNCLVRESIIGEQCVIGFGSEIARSNLHSHVWTHSAYLGDSVVGKNVAFGAGSVSANYRLDEEEISSAIKGEKINTHRKKLGVIVGDNVRAGIHASFAPGVKIGSGSFISSAAFVSSDVRENRYVHTKEGILEERDNKADVPGIRS